MTSRSRSSAPAASPATPDSAAARLAGGLVVALFLVCFMAVAPDLEGTGQVEARGPFWSLRTRRGRVLAVDPGRPRLALRPGSSLMLGEGDRIESVSLRIDPVGRQSASVDLELCVAAGASYRLSVVPAPRFTAHLQRLAIDGTSTLLAQVERDDAATGPFQLSLHREADRIEATLDGQALLEAHDDRLRPAAAGVWGDEVDLLAVEVRGLRDDEPFTAREEFAALADPRAGRVGAATAALQALALWLGIVAWLASLSPGKSLASACLVRPALLLAGPTLTLALAGLLPRQTALIAARLGSSPGALVLLVACAASLPGVQRVLSRSGVDARRGPGLALLPSLLLGALAIVRIGEARLEQDRPWLEAVAECLPGLTGKGLSYAGTLELDAGRVVTLDGPLRSLILEGDVVLEPRTVLEVRLRDSGRTATGVSLLLSTHPGQPSGFRNADDLSFDPLCDPAPAPPADRVLRLRIEARGAELDAWIDDEPFAHAIDEQHAAGNVVVLAPAGRATLTDSRVEPLTPEPPAPPGWSRSAAGAWPAVLLLLVMAALLRAASRRPFVGAIASAAFALLPLALAAGHLTPTGHLAWFPFLTAALGASAIALVPLWTARVGWARGLAASLVLLALPPVALATALGRPERADRFDGADLFDVPAPGLDAELAFFQHPRLRRFNPRLRNHSFRERLFPLERPDGGARVMCVGSSSTWGFAIPPASGGDWPRQLEERLRATLPDRPVEVLNAGVPGMSIGRMLPLWRGDLARFAPDVVLLCFGYNDCAALSMQDELAVLEQLVALGRPPDWLEAWRGRSRARTGSRDHARLARAVAAGEGDAASLRPTLAPGPDHATPPKRFERALEAWAEAVAAGGAKLVLVREPARTPSTVPWLPELHDTMETVGQRLGLPVVDLQPAIDAAGGPHLFMDAVHPLAEAHHVTAGVLAPVVLEQLAER